MDAEVLEANAEQRISDRISERLNPLLIPNAQGLQVSPGHQPDQSEPKKTAHEGQPTAPLMELDSSEAFPVSAYVSKRPPAFAPAALVASCRVSVAVTSSLVHSSENQVDMHPH